jgi:NlpC/P60 family putative phage cell wall peptidase
MTEQVKTGDEGRGGEEIVAIARAWLGTPYKHQSSCRGAGTDCLGLLRGVWRELIGNEPEAVPPYTADWSEPAGSEDLQAAARRHLRPVHAEFAQAGDVLLLRMHDGGVAKHIGFLARDRAGSRTMIHAYSGHGVVESPLTPAWARRIASVFRFPDRRV